MMRRMRHRKEEKEKEEEEEVNGVRSVPRAWNPSTQTSNVSGLE